MKARISKIFLCASFLIGIHVLTSTVLWYIAEHNDSLHSDGTSQQSHIGVVSIPQKAASSAYLNLWTTYPPFTRWYIPDGKYNCNWTYITTLKTGSKATRDFIDRKECGYGVNLFYNHVYWKSCGNHECATKDLELIEHRQHTMIFVRHPLKRIVSVYNFWCWNFEFHNGCKFDKILPKYIRSIQHLRQNYSYSSNKYVNDFYHFVNVLHKAVTEQNYDVGRNKMEGYWMHVQPIFLSACNLFHQKCPSTIGSAKVSCKLINTSKCFCCITPTVVARSEALDSELVRIAKFIGFEPHYATERVNPTITKRVTLEDLIDNQDILLKACFIYWNDFFCGGYNMDIPPLCLKENEETWMLPNECVSPSTDKFSFWSWNVSYEFEL